MRRVKLGALAFVVLCAAAFVDGNFTHLSTVSHWATPAAAGPALGPADPSPDGWAPPLDRSSFAGSVHAKHSGYPALDIGAAAGVPIRAIRGGSVSFAGGTCGQGVQIVDNQGVGWKYCHPSRRHVAEGATVETGAVIAEVGATGRTKPPGANHLHLEVYANGARCPGDLLAAIYAGTTPPDPYTLPRSGCFT